METPEREVAHIAGRQRGLITWWQLIAAGWSKSTIERRCANGWLHKVHRGVYAVGNPNLTPEARMLAAVLACGEGALLSHTSAAWLWKLLDLREETVHVTVPGRRTRDRPGISTYAPTAWSSRDQRMRLGIPTKSPTATIVDLATIDASLAENALNEALLLRLTSRDEVLSAISARPGRRGIGELRQLAHGMSGNDFSRRKAEKILWSLIRATDLPEPRRNVVVHGLELDFYWPDLRLNVETDGYQWHSTKAKLNRDRERDATLMSRGIRVLRFSFDQLKDRDRTLARLAATIGAITAGT